MKIEPKSSPSLPANTQPSGVQSSRDRAIAMLSAQPAPINQNNIAPEDTSVASTGQNNTNVVESKSTESVSEAPKTSSSETEDPISTQYASLARKEKALRVKAMQAEAAVKAKEDAIAAREAAFKSKEEEYQSKYISKDELTQDTLNALAKAGLTYDQITELMLNQNNPERKAQSEYEKRLDAKLQELENKQKLAEKATVDNQTAQYQQAIKQITNDTTQLVNSDPNFETIKETNSVSDVVELIERTFKQTGVLLSVEDAARDVEEYLVEEAFKLTRLKKIQQRLTPAVKPAEVKQSEPTKQPQTLKTLTNAVSSPSQMSRRDRAIAAMKGQLK